MNLKLKRIFQHGNATTGVLFINDKPEAFTIEDVKREVKIKGKTRIPAGVYEVKLKKIITPLTKKYREKYHWFEWHLELQNVPGFDSIYIHIGNTALDTEGCIIVGATATTKGFIGDSTITFRVLYEKICKVLNSGDKVFIKIIDE